MRIHAITLAAALSFICGFVQSAPLTPTPVSLVEGKVVAFVWMDGFKYEEANAYEGVNPVGARKYPSRYFLLVDAPKLNKKVSKQISNYASLAKFTTAFRFRSREDSQVIVVLNQPRLEQVKEGAKIKIEGYILGGDEFDVWPSYKSISINGEIVSEKKKDRSHDHEDGNQQGEQGSAEQPATAPKSKPEGNEKPQPESEGRSQ